MARYQDAIRWIIREDDTEWLDGKLGTASGQASITAAMVADIFSKTDEQVRQDLLNERRRHERKLIKRSAHDLTAH